MKKIIYKAKAQKTQLHTQQQFQFQLQIMSKMYKKIFYKLKFILRLLDMGCVSQGLGILRPSPSTAAFPTMVIMGRFRPSVALFGVEEFLDGS